ncbi:MAG: Holliday junction branch migration protein RuvA [Deltaproteobacteria bacterium]|nr:Holliday junction branch migration protein RuvA [Deltaproteobacteria bacterium]
MIAQLIGVVMEKRADHLVLDVGGVGYRVFASAEALASFPGRGEKALIRTHTHVREDAIELYGFSDAREEAIFHALIGVPKVGCRKALVLLSGIGAAQIVAAVRSADAAALARAPGVGAKTAERLVLELKGKLDGLATGGSAEAERGGDEHLADLVSGLIGLGYRAAAAQKAAELACEQDPEGELPQLLKAALAHLRDGS